MKKKKNKIVCETMVMGDVKVLMFTTSQGGDTLGYVVSENGSFVKGGIIGSRPPIGP
jgi:hypothetical protein